MTEQSGPTDPSGRPGTERTGAEQPARDRPGTDRSTQSSPPRMDVIGDLHRWLIRQGAKNVRKEIGGQVRRTFGGGRSSTADVWDKVTHEIPPVEGEAPECQWCPICRAARRMRESGPGIGGQLSGAGEAVASAVQDAINALDGLLSKTGGGQRDSEPQRTAPRGTGPQSTGPQDTRPQDTGSPQAETDPSRGPVGRATAADPWSTATEDDVPEPGPSGPSASDSDISDSGTSGPAASDSAASVAEDFDVQAPRANSDPGTHHDGRGHEPDDRS